MRSNNIISFSVVLLEKSTNLEKLLEENDYKYF